MASGPSGPNISRAQRKRRKVEISLSDDVRAWLDAQAERMDLTRSGLVEGLILGAMAQARHARR